MPMIHNFTTLPSLLKYTARVHENPTALAYKRNGVWTGVSTAEVLETTRKIGAGLLEMGLKPGDRVGLVANPSPFWMMMDFAVLGAGGITVPLFSNIAPDNLRYEISDSGMRFLFVGSEEQYLAMQPFFQPLERIISLTPISGAPDCVSWQDLIALGERRRRSNPDEWDTLADAVREKDTATLIYTSGSTGIPKGVELTHQNLTSQVIAIGIRFMLDAKKDKVLSCLPLAHVFERIATYYYFSTGASLYFVEEIKKVGADLREVQPTVITLVPRLFEKIFARMQADVEKASGLRKRLGRAAFDRARVRKNDTPFTLMDRVFDALVYRKMRRALGGKLNLVISGGAPLDPALCEFFLNIGVPVYEGYGLTETSPVISANFPGHRKVGTVGPVFPGVEVRIGDDGEILARGPNIMKGYHGKPAETAEMIDAEGWLHTGDLGLLDGEGYLKITGRKKELFKTANGKYVAPVPIEQALAANKLVDMAMVLAEGKPFATALLFPDMENLKFLKPDLRLESMDNGAFLQSQQVRDYLNQIVDEINSQLNAWEKIQKFHLADRALSIEAGELTPTLKIRRHIVAEKFRPEIEALYNR